MKIYRWLTHLRLNWFVTILLFLLCGGAIYGTYDYFSRKYERLQATVSAVVNLETEKSVFITHYLSRVVVFVDTLAAYEVLGATYDFTAKYKVPVPLMLSLFEYESGFKKANVSYKGAIGIGQVLESTGRLVAKALQRQTYDLFDVRDNVEFSCFLMSTLLPGGERRAVAEYNAGGEWLIATAYAEKVIKNKKKWE